MNDRTIVALATASGLGALTVLRLSGPEALRIATERFKSNSGWTPRQSILGRFLDSEDRMLDEGLATFFIGPWSFTGEDVVEFGLHGSPFIAAQAVEALIASGAELAAPGEFTQRAFANGKLDLAQAEAVAPKKDSLLDRWVLDGGPTMILIGFAVIAFIALAVYNFMNLTKAKFCHSDLKMALMDHMANCRVRSAIELAA